MEILNRGEKGKKVLSCTIHTYPNRLIELKERQSLAQEWRINKISFEGRKTKGIFWFEEKEEEKER